MSLEFKELSENSRIFPIRGDIEHKINREKYEIICTLEKCIYLQGKDLARIYSMEIEYHQSLSTNDNIHQDQSNMYELKLGRITHLIQLIEKINNQI